MRKLFIHVRILPMNLPAMEVNQYRKRKPMELEPCSRERINFHQDCCTTGKMQTVLFGVFEFSRPAKIIAKAVHNFGRRARRKVLLTSSSRVPDMAGPSAQNQHGSWSAERASCSFCSSIIRRSAARGALPCPAKLAVIRLRCKRVGGPHTLRQVL